MITIPFGGAEISLTGEGLVWVAAARLLCAADIHFEKTSFFARFATLLPPYASEETLARLEAAIAKYQPNIFIALGDSFHDLHAGARMSSEHLARLNQLITSVQDWYWIAGNHDPAITDNIWGRRHQQYEWNGIIFRHQAEEDETHPEISGHYHPKTNVTIKNNRISAPCFLQQMTLPQRLILPAFGDFTGSLDINNIVFTKLIRSKHRKVYLIHHNEIYVTS
jgi:DNA ligase-associated metallophosphoesterase